MRTILYASLAVAVLLIQIVGDPELLTGPETVADPFGTGKGSGNPFTAVSILGWCTIFVTFSVFGIYVLVRIGHPSVLHCTCPVQWSAKIKCKIKHVDLQLSVCIRITDVRQLQFIQKHVTRLRF